MILHHNPANVITRGQKLEEAGKVLVMLHGRGGSAQDILSLTDYIEDDTLAFMAPQATQSTWYPYSFMAPVSENEPGLSSALSVVETIIDRLHQEFDFAYQNIYLLGFSQGACLTLEYAARNPHPFGGVFGLSGGLIGPAGKLPKYSGDLSQTAVFLGCSDVDPHIPKERVLESEQIFEGMNARVLAKLYKNFGHSINDDELAVVNRVLTTSTL